MLELVLALQLLGAPAPAPRLDATLLPRLRGAGERVGLEDAAAPDLAAAPPRLDAGATLPRPVRAGTVAASGLGIVVADVVCMVPIVYGLLLCAGDVASFGTSGGCDQGVPFMIAGVAAFVVLPPAGAIAGARAAGERGDAAWSAYGLALAVRLGAFGLAAALPEGAGAPLVVATELVVAPYLVARVLAGAPVAIAGQPPVLALAAVPVRDPAAGPPGRLR